MRSIAQERAFQIALRKCSKEAGGKVSMCVILVKRGTCSQAQIFAEGCC